MKIKTIYYVVSLSCLMMAGCNTASIKPPSPVGYALELDFKRYIRTAKDVHDFAGLGVLSNTNIPQYEVILDVQARYADGTLRRVSQSHIVMLEGAVATLKHIGGGPRKGSTTWVPTPYWGEGHVAVMRSNGVATAVVDFELFLIEEKLQRSRAWSDDYDSQYPVCTLRQKISLDLGTNTKSNKDQKPTDKSAP